MEQHEEAPRLPSDVLADVLRRLPPRGLAACRCVCVDWRAAVDDRRLLRAAIDALLPRSLGALLVNYPGLSHTEFFSRPAAAPVSGELSTYLPDDDAYRSHTVRDHCNGLLLLDELVVVNPATRRWAHLSPPPRLDDGARGSHCLCHDYLVYDPAVSLHYEVFMIPRISCSYDYKPMARYDRPDRDRFFVPGCDAKIEDIEWPPSPFNIPVFSSRTGQWETRSFVREGLALGSVADVLPSVRTFAVAGDLSAVYWRRELYVQDQTNYVMRMSLASNRYQVIKPPLVTGGCTDPRLRLAGSEKGVYYVLHDNADPLRLRVWILDESCGQMGWMLKYDHDLSPMLELWNRHDKLDEPWALQDVNYYEDHRKEEDTVEPVDLQLEWDSDNDDFLEEGTEIDSDGDDDDICYIGFHPYKEVVFFSRSLECKGLAYHLSSSKVQNLGNLSPKCCHYTCYCVGTTFSYTPCWLEELPGSS